MEWRGRKKVEEKEKERGFFYSFEWKSRARIRKADLIIKWFCSSYECFLRIILLQDNDIFFWLFSLTAYADHAAAGAAAVVVVNFTENVELEKPLKVM